MPALFTGAALSSDLRRRIAALAPERVFLICGAARLARLAPLDLAAPVDLVLTSPRVSARELARLSPLAWWRERRVLRGPVLDAMLPGALLRHGFRRSGAAGVVYLSEAARERYTAVGLPAGTLFRPQVDAEALPPPAIPATRPRIVYLGPALELRGAWLAVEAFEAAVAQGLDAELLLLLRSDSGRASLLRLLKRIRRSPARRRMRSSTRMLSPAELAGRLST
jgi:hypothetical protein